WLTREQGRVATVAKGARRPKSPFSGKLDLFYTAEFSYSASSRSHLHNLKEVALLETLACVRTDLDLLWQATYAASFLELASEQDTPLPHTYELFQNYLSLMPHWRSAIPLPLV